MSYETTLEGKTMDKNIKILSTGDDPLISSGYGTVWLNLLRRWTKLKPDWEFYHVGWQNADRQHKTIDGYTMLPRKKAEHAFDVIVEYLLEYQPDFFISLADVGFQGGYMDKVFEAKKRGWSGKWIAYTPIDTHSWEHMFWNNIFQAPDINVAMADWGEKMMKEYNVPNVVKIPHGVNLEDFKPLNRELIRIKNGLDKKFVVGFVGRNQIRKMVDRLLLGFAQFSKGKDDVLLVLHVDLVPVIQGWNMPALLTKVEKEYDPEIDKFQKIILTKDKLDYNVRQRIQPENMNEYYNMMDIFCYSTGGEGFGLPGIECQAAGTPLMMTAHTTGFELTDYGKHGFQIEVLKDKYGRLCTSIGHNGVENAFPDDKEIARILGELYNDWKSGSKKLNEERKKAREFALSYSWDDIAKQWLSLFENES